MSPPAYTVVHETYGYEHLRGPNGEVCSLTEREDRTWGRDLSPVLTLLNEQHTLVTGADTLRLARMEIEDLRAEIARLRAR